MDPVAVILAGGLGTRLGALAEGLPKCLVPVGGRPFMELMIAELADQGFAQVVLLVGYRGEAVMSHFGDGRTWGMEILYSQEVSPLGTGGALRWAKTLLPERFLLLYGDLYRRYPYRQFLEGARGNCLAVYPYAPGLTTISCANVGVRGCSVTSYLKNSPDSGLTHVDAGFAVLSREVVELLPEGACSLEEIVYPALARNGQLEAEFVDREFLDIGNPVDLARARARFVQPSEQK